MVWKSVPSRWILKNNTYLTMEIKYTQGFFDDMDRLFSWRWAPFRFGKTLLRLPKELKWKWQRMQRGWADCDTWSLDRYISDVLIGSLTHLKENNHSLPMSFCGEMKMRKNGTWYHTVSDEDASKAWNACLQEMIDGFGSKDKEDDLENPDFSDPVAKAAWYAEIERLQAKQTKALALFAEHFNDLWD